MLRIHGFMLSTPSVGLGLQLATQPERCVGHRRLVHVGDEIVPANVVLVNSCSWFGAILGYHTK